jgi:hypothetical protein
MLQISKLVIKHHNDKKQKGVCLAIRSLIKPRIILTINTCKNTKSTTMFWIQHLESNNTVTYIQSKVFVNR